MNDGDNDGLLGPRPFVTELTLPDRVQVKDSPRLQVCVAISRLVTLPSSLDSSRTPRKTFRVHESDLPPQPAHGESGSYPFSSLRIRASR
jgi:hypothetical protein